MDNCGWSMLRGKSEKEFARQCAKETGLYPEDLPTAQDIRELRKGLKKAGKALLPLDDIDANREAERKFLQQHLPERGPELIPGCPQCSGGDPAGHNGSPKCQSGSIASGGATSHCRCNFCY